MQNILTKKRRLIQNEWLFSGITIVTLFGLFWHIYSLFDRLRIRGTCDHSNARIATGNCHIDTGKQCNPNRAIRHPNGGDDADSAAKRG